MSTSSYCSKSAACQIPFCKNTLVRPDWHTHWCARVKGSSWCTWEEVHTTRHQHSPCPLPPGVLAASALMVIVTVTPPRVHTALGSSDTALSSVITQGPVVLYDKHLAHPDSALLPCVPALSNCLPFCLCLQEFGDFRLFLELPPGWVSLLLCIHCHKQQYVFF